MVAKQSHCLIYGIIRAGRSKSKAGGKQALREEADRGANFSKSRAASHQCSLDEQDPRGRA